MIYKSKYTRNGYLRSQGGRMVMAERRRMGSAVFDTMYDSLFGFVVRLSVGQWFLIRDVCRRNPDNHTLVARMLLLMDQMDFSSNLIFDDERPFFADRVEVGPPVNCLGNCWPPPNMWLQVRRDPGCWHVDPSLIQ